MKLKVREEQRENYPESQNGWKDNQGRYAYQTMARYLIEQHGLKTLDGYSWIFNGKYYQPISNEYLQLQVMHLTEDFDYQCELNPNTIKTFADIGIKRSQVLHHMVKRPDNKINLNNGVLNLKTMLLSSHIKSNFFKSVIPIDYDPEAECPNFMQFLSDVFNGNEELYEVTSQVFGYCLLGGKPFLHKAFVLHAEGRNGKSVWLECLRMILGEDNVSNVNLSLLGKPFSAVQLEGKLANIFEEIPTSKVESDIFKTAVGGEHLTAAHKGKNEYALKVEARLVFAGNKYPRFNDSTTGLWSKLYFIPFEKYLFEDQRDPMIAEKLRSEAPGILNFALRGLKKVLETRTIYKPDIVNAKIEDFRQDMDSVFTFFTRYVGDGSNTYTSAEFYSYYVSHCTEDGVKAVGKREFGRRIKQILKEKARELKTLKYVRQGHGMALKNAHLEGYTSQALKPNSFSF